MTNEKIENAEHITRKRVVKDFKDKRKYDRFRDRKDKKVYEEDVQISEEINEEEE